MLNLCYCQSQSQESWKGNPSRCLQSAAHRPPLHRSAQQGGHPACPRGCRTSVLPLAAYHRGPLLLGPSPVTKASELPWRIVTINHAHLRKSVTITQVTLHGQFHFGCKAHLNFQGLLIQLGS